MTPDEARELIIEGMNYAAYKETDSSLHDADKNRLFGSDHLLRLANVLNRSVPAFKEAQTLLEDENSILGQVIRRAKRPDWRDSLTGS